MVFYLKPSKMLWMVPFIAILKQHLCPLMANSTIIPAVLCIKNSLLGLRQALLGKQRRELQLLAWDPVLEASRLGLGWRILDS